MSISELTLRLASHLNLLDFPTEDTPKLKTHGIGWFREVPIFVDRNYQVLDELVGEQNLTDASAAIEYLSQKIMTVTNKDFGEAFMDLARKVNQYSGSQQAIVGVVALDYFNRHYQPPKKDQSSALG